MKPFYRHPNGLIEEYQSKDRGLELSELQEGKFFDTVEEAKVTFLSSTASFLAARMKVIKLYLNNDKELTQMSQLGAAYHELLDEYAIDPLSSQFQAWNGIIKERVSE